MNRRQIQKKWVQRDPHHPYHNLRYTITQSSSYPQETYQLTIVLKINHTKEKNQFNLEYMESSRRKDRDQVTDNHSVMIKQVHFGET